MEVCKALVMAHAYSNVVMDKIEECLKHGLTGNDYEEETYDKYNGAYAQDIAGYDDDTIDTAFEGDPEAYWNID